MTNRRTLIRTMGAGLLLATAHRALANAAGTCEPPACETCGPTGSSTAGPFYVSNAPAGPDINRLQAPGTPMRVTGRVLGGRDGLSPLAGARVELWQADGEGRYHPEDNGDIARYRPEQVNLRGQLLSDADGRFSFLSIVPAHYGPRRRHLHWRVEAPGHRVLITQTYWKDEQGSARERADPVDRQPETCRWIDFRSEGSTVSGEALFVLQSIA